MPRYSDDIINEVFSENDIVDYISQYVALKKSGKDYSGLCPFHREKSPSFHVSQDKQLFHCFGCGASGNLVQFVMRMEMLDFVDALKILADRAGIVLPENASPANSKLYEKKKLIYQMNKLTARFFYDTLIKDPQAETARQYFMSRKLTPKTITTFGLGYAPNSQNALFNYLIKNGYKAADIVEAGLANMDENGNYYDRFRHRVIVPIIDEKGNVVAFGGRKLEEWQKSKYINSAETPVYHKSDNLFSLNLAKREKSNEIILVEGYMDVITVYQAGVRNVVASCGTAFGEQQAKKLFKYCSEILLCQDSDEAGQKAILDAIDVINKVGGKARVVRLTGEKDPDDYIKANGVEMFKQAVKNAMPSTEFKLMLLRNKHDLTTTDGKIKFVNAAAESLTGINDTVEVDAYIQKLSDETQVSSDAIYSAYKKSITKNDMQKKYPKPQYTSSIRKNKSDNKSEEIYTEKLIKAERRLLNLITQYKKLFKLTEAKTAPEDFSTEVHKKLASLIYEDWKNEKIPEPARLINNFSGTELNEVSSVFYNMETYDDEEKTVADLITTIKKEKLQLQISKETDALKLRELLQQLTKLGEE